MTWQRNIAAAARGGHIVQRRRRSAAPTPRSIAGAPDGKQLTLSGSTLRPQTREAKAAIADEPPRATCWPALADGRLRAARGSAPFPSTMPPRPIVAMEAREHLGKIVLVTPFGASQVDAADADNPIANQPTPRLYIVS